MPSAQPIHGSPALYGYAKKSAVTLRAPAEWHARARETPAAERIPRTGVSVQDVSRARLAAPTMTSAYCRTEGERTGWQHAGYATTTGGENTVRPRAVYISCRSCRLVTLRLADVYDVFGLCLAVEKEWRRRTLGRLVRSGDGSRPQQADGIRYDTDNLLGALFEHAWKLYTKWEPRRLTFTSYATGILRKKIHTFIAADLGDAAGTRVNPKAHSRTVCASYDELAADDDAEHRLVFAHGRGVVDSDAGGSTAGGWAGAVRDRGPAGPAVRAAGEAAGGAQASAA